jgi:hypothetical protein
MKKLFAVVCALLLGASLSFAQATGGSTDKKVPREQASTTSGKKGKVRTKSHSKKGGKKNYKGGKKELNPQPLPPKPPDPNQKTPK